MTLPLRSLLFAPASRPDVLRKLPRSRPDGVVLDLEDAVAASGKAEARANAREIAQELIGEPGAPAVFVRVNAVTSNWFASDIAEGLCDGLTGIFVPKLQKPSHVDRVVGALMRAGRTDLALCAGLETAAGVLNASAVLETGVAYTYFGAEDFVADMGGIRRPDNLEVLHARSHVALAARVAGTVAFDMVVTEFGDDQRIRRESAEARALGYAGKLCIHPDQVPIVNEAFVPTPEEVDRARRIVDVYDEAAVDGHAAVALDGELIDEPLVRRARVVLASADRV